MASEVYVVEGVAGNTYRETSGDAAKGIAESVLIATDIDGNDAPCEQLEIQIEDNPIWYAFGVNPTNTGDKLGFVKDDGSTIIIKGHDKIKKFKFISGVAGNAAVLQIMPTYREELQS